MPCLPAAGPGGTRTEGDVADDRAVGEEVRALCDQADPAAVRRHGRQVAAREHDAAVARAEEAGEGLDDGRLAGAVRPDQRDALVGADRQAHVDVPLGHEHVRDEPRSTARHVVTGRVRTVVVPITTRATTTRTSASATAVSGSISRCR